LVKFSLDYLDNYQKNIIFAVVWHHVPDSPEKDSIIEEILIGISEAKKRYNEIKDKQ
jgi:hypothetical protein